MIIYKKDKIPNSISSLISLSIIYGLVAAILVGLHEEINPTNSDSLSKEALDRRDNIEISTIVFLALSALVGLAFFTFYIYFENNRKYYERFIVLYVILLVALTTLTGLQFYYYKDDGVTDEALQFTRWWPLASFILILVIIVALYRFAKLV